MCMRTTIELAEDAAKALEQLRQETGMGVSEAVNHLLRRGLLFEAEHEPFVQQTRSLGLRIDITSVADAIDLLESSQAQ